ncbi:MAG: SpoIIE family protein phosphatase [Streptomycetaceae bacterium]|nr:SpoIIE family protein phosphatase [Streptomycetaceae bacterium]
MTYTAGSIVRVGADGRLSGFDRRFERATGLTPEALEKPLIEVLGSRLSPRAAEAWAELVAAAHTAPDGVAVRVVEIPAADGAAVACMFEARAVGEETELREVPGSVDVEVQLATFRLAATLGGFGLWTYDIAASTWRWHGGRAQLSPVRGGADWMARVHDDDRPVLQGLHAALVAGERAEVRIEYRLLDAADEWHWIESYVQRLRLGLDGREVLVGVNRDRTDVVGAQAEGKRRLAAERERGARLAEVSAAMIAAVTEEALGEVMMARVAPLFGGTGAFVGFVHGDRFRMTNASRPDDMALARLDGTTLDERRPLHHAIRSGEAIFVPSRRAHERAWPDASELIAATGAHAYAAIPFEVGKGPIGALVIIYDHEHHPSSDERALMRTLGQLAGQAVERIRLQQALTELAHALQRTMMPSDPPDVPGLEIAARYAPAGHGLSMGGDWYDVLPLGDGTALLSIGDAQGHDVDAAAHMGHLVTTGRAFASHDPTPSLILGRVNNVLASLGRDNFATCTLLRLDPATGACAVARAGHVPMIVIGPDGAAGILETPGGPILGALEGAEYPQHETVLRPGTTIVLVTDGVVESRDMPIEVGMRRAADRAAACAGDGVEAIADAMLRAAGETGGEDDDAAVLVVRVRGASTPDGR